MHNFPVNAMNLWDHRFAEPGFKYGTEPNAFLRDQAIRFLPSSQVLVPGDGEGRNGVWLATKGHTVTSVDSSAVGLKKAQSLAESRGVALETELVDLQYWQPPEACFDALVLIYTHLPVTFRQMVHRRLAIGLQVGGWVVLEAFHPAQLGYRSGGPSDATMLYTPEQIGADFDGLVDVALAWQGRIELSEGTGHLGAAHVTRWVGRRVSCG
jgi:hypothetical protein